MHHQITPLSYFNITIREYCYNKIIHVSIIYTALNNFWEILFRIFLTKFWTKSFQFYSIYILRYNQYRSQKPETNTYPRYERAAVATSIKGISGLIRFYNNELSNERNGIHFTLESRVTSGQTENAIEATSQLKG